MKKLSGIFVLFLLVWLLPLTLDAAWFPWLPRRSGAVTNGHVVVWSGDGLYLIDGPVDISLSDDLDFMGYSASNVASVIFTSGNDVTNVAISGTASNIDEIASTALLEQRIAYVEGQVEGGGGLSSNGTNYLDMATAMETPVGLLEWTNATHRCALYFTTNRFVLRQVVIGSSTNYTYTPLPVQ